MLLLFKSLQAHLLSLLQVRQRRIFNFRLIVFSFLINRDKSGKFQALMRRLK